MYLLGAPCPHWVEWVLGGKEVVFWVPTLHLVVQGQEVKVVALGNPSSPSLKGDFPVFHIRILISHRISPSHWWWVSMGCVQLSESDLPVEILHELSQHIICKIPKVCLQLVWGPSTWVGVAKGKMGFLLPSGGQRLGARRFPIYHCHIGPHMGSRRWEFLTLMASLQNVDAFMTPCAVTCSLSAVWNSMTDSIVEY